MKLLIAVIALSALSGCAYYVAKDGTWSHASQYQARECGADVKTSAQYPTAVDSFQPGGMDRSALRIQALEDACMARAGYTRKS